MEDTLGKLMRIAQYSKLISKIEPAVWLPAALKSLEASREIRFVTHRLPFESDRMHEGWV